MTLIKHRIMRGDVMKRLAELPDESVHCVVTSPPYWGLRSYLPDDHPDKALELGTERTPDEYVARASSSPPGGNEGVPDEWKCPSRGQSMKGIAKMGSGLKPKDLCLIPFRLTLALQAHGWWLRSAIIWSKPNPMPESVDSRPSMSHEHVFLLAKSGRTQFWTHREKVGTRSRPSPDYRWVHRETGDEVAVMPDNWATDKETRKEWRRVNLWSGHDYFYDAEAIAEPGAGPSRVRNDRIGGATGDQVRHSPGGMMRGSKTRNARSVWIIPTQPYAGAHFATYPEALAQRCIRAGTSPMGACVACGAPRARVVERDRPPRGSGDTGKYDGADKHSAGKRVLDSVRGARAAGGDHDNPWPAARTVGWRPTCMCLGLDGDALWLDIGMHPDEWNDWPGVPCVVLDPFVGSGTTLAVAKRLGRSGIGIELSAENCVLAQRRVDEATEQMELVL